MAICVGVMAACGSNIPGPYALSPPAAVTIGYSDNGRTLVVRPFQPIAVNLPSTEGELWTVPILSDSKLLRVLSQGVAADGSVHMVLLARAPGVGSISATAVGVCPSSPSALCRSISTTWQVTLRIQALSSPS